MPLHLLHHPERLAIARLDGGTDPDWPWRVGPLASITFAETETSIITLAEAVPAGVISEGPFDVFEVAGPLNFAMVGVMAEILAPLVDERISALAVSTYDTDWVLVPSPDAPRGTDALRRAGLIVTPRTLTGGSSS